MLLFNEENMKKYFVKFDPIEFKYKTFTTIDEYDLYRKIFEFEDVYQFSELTEKDFWDLKNNLDLVYKDDKITKDFVEIYNMINEKIIQKYLGIDSLERLFSKEYANFEWEMHLGLNHKKYTLNYYRDHFIHQVKDAYMMVCMMDSEKNGLYESISNALLKQGDGKLSRYVEKMICQQLYQLNIIYELNKEKDTEENTSEEKSKPFQEGKKFFHDMTQEQLRQGIHWPDAIFTEMFCKLPKKEVGKLLKKHYLHNIIYMAAYMAGLFHDIGYPATMGMQSNKRTIEYIAEEYYFGHGSYDFNQITILLQNSLLFHIVGQKEIKKRTEKENMDHGTMSALLFLLHFYENGLVHGMEPYKRCAMELAALAIYNHTNEYDYISDDMSYGKRAVFKQDPISYLLRFCDDMQEWGRIYFEVSDQPSLVICEKCHLPIKKHIKGKEVQYQCKCMETKRHSPLFSTAFPNNYFPYRRIYNVTVCKEVKAEIKKDFSGALTCQFHLNYDLGRLLHIAFINRNYARYRTEELLRLKKFFLQQQYIGMVFVDYLVTANIIFIKASILGEYVKYIKTYQYEGYTKKWLEDIDNLFEKETENEKKFTSQEAEKGINLIHDNMDELVENIETVLECCKKMNKNDLNKELDLFYHKLDDIGDNVRNFSRQCLNRIEYNKVYCSKLSEKMDDYIKNIYNNIGTFNDFLCGDLGTFYASSYDEKAIKLYILIHGISCLYRHANTLNKEYKKELPHLIQKILINYINKEETFYEKAKVLIMDCNDIASGLFDSLQHYAYYPKNYLKSKSSNADKLYDEIENFLDLDTYDPCSDMDKKSLDGYTDLYYIKKMLKAINESKNNKPAK